MDKRSLCKALRYHTNTCCSITTMDSWLNKNYNTTGCTLSDLKPHNEFLTATLGEDPTMNKQSLCTALRYHTNIRCSITTMDSWLNKHYGTTGSKLSDLNPHNEFLTATLSDDPTMDKRYLCTALHNHANIHCSHTTMKSWLDHNYDTTKRLLQTAHALHRQRKRQL